MGQKRYSIISAFCPHVSMSLLILCLSLILPILTTSASSTAERLRISVKGVALRTEERIESFSFRVKFATIRSFGNIPVGWKVNLSNSEHESTNASGVITGTCGVGASRVGSEFLDNFVVYVDKSNKIKPGQSPSAELTVTSQVRDITITKPELVIVNFEGKHGPTSQ